MVKYCQLVAIESITLFDSTLMITFVTETTGKAPLHMELFTTWNIFENILTKINGILKKYSSVNVMMATPDTSVVLIPWCV